MKTVLQVLAVLILSNHYANASVATVSPGGTLNLTAPSHTHENGNLILHGAANLTGFNGTLIEFDGPLPVLKTEIDYTVTNTTPGETLSITTNGLSVTTNHTPWVSTNIAVRSKLIPLDIHTNTLTNVRIIDLAAQDAQKAAFVGALISTYVSFLETEWTPTLRQYGLIPVDRTVTIHNTSTAETAMLMLQLRALDTAPNKPTYSYFRDEFDAFVNRIEGAGYTVAGLSAMVAE